jgi:mannitol-1-phosphate 5-dehydrogenase
MPVKNAVIFGAGKIARAFIAHLLTLSGYRIVFVEKSPELVALLRERKRYTVHILGAPEKDIVIKDFEVLAADQTDAVATKLALASVVFISIGGPNLPQIAPLIAAGIRRSVKAGRQDPLNFILCENYFQPAAWLRQLVSEQLEGPELDWLKQKVGFVETMVLRSSIEPTPEMKAEDPLSLKAQDMWEMPADKEAFVGPIPEILGLAPKEKFQASLTRKLFTYNAINAVFCYLGYLKGYELLSDAANDPELIAVAEAAAKEASEAIVKRFGFDPEDQRQFAAAAIAKYQKREIVDPIERNARDPIRKLARNDRLVGPAMLAIEEGGNPQALARAIAAGLRYDPPGDPAAQKVQAIIRNSGLDAALRDVCGIHPEGQLAGMVKQAYAELAPDRL